MHLTMTITGMHCESCVALVRSALEIIEGVDIDKVEIGTALVTFDADRTSKNALFAAVRQANSFEISSFQAKP